MSQVTPDFIVEHCKRHKLPIPRNVQPDAIAVLPAPAKSIDIGNGEVVAITVKLAMRVVSEANAGGRNRAKFGRKSKVKAIVNARLGLMANMLPPLPAKITLTRFALHRLRRRMRPGRASVAILPQSICT